MKYNVVKHGRQRRGLLVGFVLVLVLIGAGVIYVFRPNLNLSSTSWPFRREMPPVAADFELAAWEWRKPQEFTSQDVREYMDYAKSEHISTIYIDISHYVDIHETTDPLAKAKALDELNLALKQFVKEGHRQGVEVEALAGSVQWAEPDFRYLPGLIVDYVGIYNAAAGPEERLGGIQFDIESHNLKDFDSRQSKVLTNLLDTVADLQQRHAALKAANPDLELGFTVPYWYDNENGKVPPIEWQGSTKPVGYHLMDILQKGPNGYIAIMDYQTKASGKSGSIARAYDEFQYAGGSAPGVKIVIGQLASEADPATTTFYKQDKQKLFDSLKELQAAYQGSPNFDGFAIHDYSAYKKLKYRKDK